MSKLINGILGLLAASAAFGITQFASGSDLGIVVRGSPPVAQSQIAETTVNRRSKGDRATVIGSSGTGQTLTVQNSGMSGTSLLLRLQPASTPVETARNNPAPSPVPATRRFMLACEPVVSVLTSIAKQLPPGRCVT